MLCKIVEMLKDPKLLWLTLDYHGLFRAMSDERNIRIKYRLRTGRKLNLDNPVRFNEKLQWIKLYDRRPEYSVMADKYLVRNYIMEKLGEKYLIPFLGVWNKAEEIDFDQLPEQFVLKCNHDSGSVVICRDRSCFDKQAAMKKLNKGLKRNGFWYGREWPYKNIQPRIIAEKCMTDESGTELKDYKVMCFDGKAKLIQIHRGRYKAHTQDFYDTDWNHLDVFQGCDQSDTLMEKPAFLQDMLELSEKLAEGIPHVRVDWYYVEGQLYFGELTFFDASGFDEFEPDHYNELLGSWITLPQKNTKE